MIASVKKLQQAYIKPNCLQELAAVSADGWIYKADLNALAVK